MALTQRLEFRQSQSLVMTPQLMQAIKLLQLSNLDLSAFVEEELERNPLLERAADSNEPPVAGEQGAERAVGERALIGGLDVRAGVVDQMHVIHAGRACGHAGQAGQAAVDMSDHVPARRPAVLQHVLDQVDAPARAVELVAEQRIGRTGGGAEAAMHAGAQDFFRFGDLWIEQLGEREGGLHSRRGA